LNWKCEIWNIVLLSLKNNIINDMPPARGTTHVRLCRLLATHKNSTTKVQMLVNVWASLAQRMVDFQLSQGFLPYFKIWPKLCMILLQVIHWQMLWKRKVLSRIVFGKIWGHIFQKLWKGFKKYQNAFNLCLWNYV
jgi:hypothetical protein